MKDERVKRESKRVKRKSKRVKVKATPISFPINIQSRREVKTEQKGEIFPFSELFRVRYRVRYVTRYKGCNAFRICVTLIYSIYNNIYILL